MPTKSTDSDSESDSTENESYDRLTGLPKLIWEGDDVSDALEEWRERQEGSDDD